MISYIIYTLSVLVILGSSITLGRRYGDVNLPFINENNVYIFLISAIMMLYMSSSYMTWVRDVDTICKERERIK